MTAPPEPSTSDNRPLTASAGTSILLDPHPAIQQAGLVKAPFQIPDELYHLHLMKVKAEVPGRFENDPLFLEVMAEDLAIQDCFSAEPLYAK